MHSLFAPTAKNVVLWAGLASLASACSSDENKNSNASALDPNKELNQLSNQESTQLCNEILSNYNTQIPVERQREYLCAVSAAISSAFQTAFSKDTSQTETRCLDTYEKCLQASAQLTTAASVSSADCASFSASVTSCNGITVAQVNQCSSEQLALIKTISAATACGQIRGASGAGGTGVTSAFDATSISANGASCQAIQQKCPNTNVVSSNPAQSQLPGCKFFDHRKVGFAFVRFIQDMKVFAV